MQNFLQDQGLDNRQKRTESEQEQQWRQLQAARQLQSQQVAALAIQHSPSAIPSLAISKGLGALEPQAIRPIVQPQQLMELRLQVLSFLYNF